MNSRISLFTIKQMAVVAICGFLISCSSTEYYTQSTSFGGLSANSLQRLGKPDIQYHKPNGNTVLIYKTITYRANVPSARPTVGVNVNAGRPVIVAPNSLDQISQPSSISLSCTKTVEVDNHGVIISVKLTGTCTN